MLGKGGGGGGAFAEFLRMYVELSAALKNFENFLSSKMLSGARGGREGGEICQLT